MQRPQLYAKPATKVSRSIMYASSSALEAEVYKVLSDLLNTAALFQPLLVSSCTTWEINGTL